MDVQILFRSCSDTLEEFEIARSIWGEDNVVNYRALCRPGSLVVGRYSVLPYYKESYEDLALSGAHLIHTPDQHDFCADLRRWYPLIEDLTFKSYWGVGYGNVPDSPEGWVVKGQTNSRKQLWNTHMRAPTRQALRDVMVRLMDDTLIGHQDLIVREFVPLEFVEESLNGLQASNEWRVFVLDGQILCTGFYWSWVEEPPEHFPVEAEAVVLQAIERLSALRFYVLDVAKTAAGDWKIVELNAGQMSGLSLCDPTLLYTRLRERLTTP